MFDDQTLADLKVDNDGLYLYRHTVPTNISNLGFVGSELACISNISSYGVQAAWLAKLWAGEMPTPSTDAMEVCACIIRISFM